MATRPRIRFLGTGAGGGTPGTGRSRRRESSALLTDDDATVLIDVTRDLDEQATLLDRLDGVLLTHGHADAVGGIGALRRHLDGGPIPVHAAPRTIDAIRRRFARLDHCELQPFEPGDRTRIGSWTVTCLAVPHAADAARYPTYAWKLTSSGRRLVYASDVSRLTGDLRDFARDAGILVLDGSTYGRRIFTHLRIDEDLPEACAWPVGRILLTQIGRSAPPHEDLVGAVRGLCPRAEPAHDGLEVEIP